MSVVSTLERQKQICISAKNNLQSQIGIIERNYESLRNFKEVVLNSQEEFYAIKGNHVKEINDLLCLVEKSEISKKYYSGMSDFVDGFASKAVGTAYTAMLTSISIKLQSYICSIRTIENQIVQYSNTINSLEYQITQARLTEQIPEGG